MRRTLLLTLAAMLLFGCALPTIAMPRVTLPDIALPAAQAPSGTILYKDDFLSPVSGWDRQKFAEGIMDYDSGGYRMLVNALDLNFWSSPHKDFTNVRVEADAGKMGGPDENRIGLICRLSQNNYYFFIITSDGYYGLGLFNNGMATLLGQEQMKATTAINRGMAVNHLRMDCSGDNLAGFVNGFEVVRQGDATLKHGDVGLLAGTFKQPGADIIFDNFVVFAP